MRGRILSCGILLLLGLPGKPAARAQCFPQEQAELTAPDGAPLDHFGAAVALSGETAVIGAYSQDDAGAVDAGVAHVFVRSAEGAWAPQARLVAPDGLDDDYFGYAAAIDADTAVIGAYQADIGSTLNAGAAYVFVRSGGVWTFQAKIAASDRRDDDWFGCCVAIRGDTAVIGAYQRDDGSRTDAGAAYVFVRSGGAWTQQARLIAADAAAFDYFGRSVAIDGSIVVVGASGADRPGAAGAGAAYVFSRSGAAWTQEAQLTASDAAAGDGLGFSVGVSLDTVIAGAVYDDHAGGTNAGAAYVFLRSGGTWTLQAKLTASDPAGSDIFGRSVAIEGHTAIVGASQDDTPAGANVGSVYIFTRAGTVWTESGRLHASDAAASDFLGSCVSISGDTALSGAMFDDNSHGTDAGGAYVFSLGCPSPVPFDYNRDGRVDATDLARFSVCATRAGVIGPPPGCSPADFGISDHDRDADADMADFAVLQLRYSGTFAAGRECAQ